MSEEFKPLFPRSQEDEEKRKKLLWETQGKLEKEENSSSGNKEVFCPFCAFKNIGEGYFCRQCGSPLESEKSKTKSSEEKDFPMPVYGPPPMDFDETHDEIHVTVYGPAPMPFDDELKPVPLVYGPPSFILENKEDNFNPPLPVYGPPPMPFKERDMPMPVVYGPPPMPIPGNNKLLIFIGLLLFGLILVGAVIAVIIYFLFLR